MDKSDLGWKIFVYGIASLFAVLLCLGLSNILETYFPPKTEDQLNYETWLEEQVKFEVTVDENVYRCTDVQKIAHIVLPDEYVLFLEDGSNLYLTQNTPFKIAETDVPSYDEWLENSEAIKNG